MSHTYHLMCRECHSTLDLGKIICFDEAERPIPWAFGGWRDLKHGTRIEGSLLWRVVERFLIVHRNHPLQIISEPYLMKRDPEGLWDRFDSADEVLACQPIPEPDDYDDASEVETRDAAEKPAATEQTARGSARNE
jgi:hypothetical protein